jgi:tetratricopeptide (TPR) repeat protein
MSSEHLAKANRLFLSKKFHDACSEYDVVLRLEPTNIEALNNKGYALSKLKKYQDALECYEAALRIAPNDKSLLVNKISALRKTKRYDDALAYCQQILKLEPDDNITLYHMERILYSLEKFAESISCCDKILCHYQDNAEVLLDRAASLARLGKTDDALATLSKCINANPKLKFKISNNSAFSHLAANPTFMRIISEQSP